jgi:hypothetical protein
MGTTRPPGTEHDSDRNGEARSDGNPCRKSPEQPCGSPTPQERIEIGGTRLVLAPKFSEPFP